MWMLIGVAVGWLAFSYLGLNVARGLMVAMIIGALGGFVGGSMVAPLFAGPPPAPDGFGFSAVFFAAAIAAAFVAIGNLVHNRWGV